MTNEASVGVAKPSLGCPFTVWLADGDTLIVGGSRTSGQTSDEFRFRTVVGSSTGGAKTDSNGGIYVQGVILPGPGYGSSGPDYEFELWATPEGAPPLKIQEVDVSIAPLLTDLSYTPDILASPPETFDPYSDLDDLSGVGDPEPDGYGAGEYFGLNITFDLDDDLACAPTFVFYNDPTVPSWGGDAGIVGEYELYLDPEEDSGVATAGTLNKQIKWEGFTDNAVVRQNGFAERGTRVFMEGLEAELPLPFDMGDGVMQSHRGVAPRFVVKEGDYVNEFRVRRAADPIQQQKLAVPFEVKYETE